MDSASLVSAQEVVQYKGYTLTYVARATCPSDNIKKPFIVVARYISYTTQESKEYPSKGHATFGAAIRYMNKVIKTDRSNRVGEY